MSRMWQHTGEAVEKQSNCKMIENWAIYTVRCWKPIFKIFKIKSIKVTFLILIIIFGHLPKAVVESNSEFCNGAIRIINEKNQKRNQNP